MTKSRRTSDLVNSILVNPDNSVNIHEGTESPYFLLTTGATPTPQQGMFFWDADRQTAGLQMNGVEARLGQDNFWYVKNQSGSDILKGTAVMAVGALGASSRILIAPMVADGSAEELYLLGVTAEDILNGEDGFVMNIGKIRGIDTTQYGTQAGQVLYCDPANPGGFTITQPDAPNLDIPIAFTVDYKTNGTIAVRVNPGYHIGELHDVYSNSPSNNDILLYNSTNSRWENTPLSSAVPTPTLDAVTTAGNTSSNPIVIGASSLPSINLDTKLYLEGSGSGAPGRTGFVVKNTNSNSAALFRLLNSNDDFINFQISGPSYTIPSEAGVAVKNTVDLGFTAGGNVASGATNKIGFRTGGFAQDYAMTILGNKNVLIGTTTDAGYKLDVNGETRTYGLVSLGTGASSTQIGEGALAGSTGAIAIGLNTNVVQSQGIAIGTSANSVSGNGVAIGNIANTRNNGVAIGRDAGTADSFTDNGTSIGASSYAFGDAVSVGFLANAELQYSVAIGRQAASTATRGIAIGYLASASNGNDAIAIGYNTSGQLGGIAIGANTSVENNSTALGYDAHCETNGISVGYQARATDYTTALGFQAGLNATGTDNLFIGYTVGVSNTNSNWFVLGNRNNTSLIEGNFTTGNVMIGTSTDSGYRLDVNGTARIQGDLTVDSGFANEGDRIELRPSDAIAEVRAAGESTADEAAIFLGTPYTSGSYIAPTKAAIIAQGVGTYSRSKIHFCLEDTPSNLLSATVTSADARVTITKEGRLGINNTSPSYELDVNGDANITGSYHVNGTAGWSGTITIASNPPGQQNIDVQGGIIVNVF